jgi:hypothetical protein
MKDESMEVAHSGGKKHLLIAVIVLAVIVLITLHVGAGMSMYRVWLGT